MTAKDGKSTVESDASDIGSYIESLFRDGKRARSKIASLSGELQHTPLEYLENHVRIGDLSGTFLEREFLSTRIPEEPMNEGEYSTFLEKMVIENSANIASPQFIGHMTSHLPNHIFSLTKVMAVMNQNVVKIETSNVLTLLERQVIGMLHSLIFDYSDSFYNMNLHNPANILGLFCSGGTVANLTALWVARNRMLSPSGNFEGLRSLGLQKALEYHKLNGLVILASERGHFSLLKAADILGIGRKNLVKVPTDGENRISLKDLKSQVDSLRRNRIGILSIVGIAGTTETGAVDPLEDIAEICRKEGCHFHVDAAWGGPTIFSGKYRHLLKGIELGDSVTIDAHKQMYVPVGAGIVFFKNPEVARHVSTYAEYVIRKNSIDLGRFTLEGSRPAVSLLVHANLSLFGLKGFEYLINDGIDKAKAFASLIEADPDFELTSRPQLNILTYRFLPPQYRELAPAERDNQDLRDYLNDVNVKIQERQRNLGNSFVSRTTLKIDGHECNVFRVVLVNPLTTHDDLRNVLKEQAEIARAVMAESEAPVPHMRFKDAV